MLCGDLFPKTIGCSTGSRSRTPAQLRPERLQPGDRAAGPAAGSALTTGSPSATWRSGPTTARASRPSTSPKTRLMPRESGAFINTPVPDVRWASYGDQGSDMPGGTRTGATTTADDHTTGRGRLQLRGSQGRIPDLRRRRPQRPLHPQIHRAMAARDPQPRQLPPAATPEAWTPGYAPCAPYGRWDDPRNSWTQRASLRTARDKEAGTSNPPAPRTPTARTPHCARPGSRRARVRAGAFASRRSAARHFARAAHPRASTVPDVRRPHRDRYPRARSRCPATECAGAAPPAALARPTQSRRRPVAPVDPLQASVGEIRPGRSLGTSTDRGELPRCDTCFRR